MGCRRGVSHRCGIRHEKRLSTARFPGTIHLHREQLPALVDPLERMDAAILEGELGPDHEILDRSRHQDLISPRLGHHPGGEVHRYAANVVAANLDFSSVNSGADVQVEVGDPALETGGARDGAPRADEGGEDAVSGRPDPATGLVCHRLFGDLVVAVEESLPTAVAELLCSPRGVNDVGEHDGGELTIGFPGGLCAGDEFLDRGNKEFRVLPIGSDVAPGISTSLALGMCSAM